MRNEKVSSYESSNDYDQRELQNVHPPDWKNPEPIDKYHLVVIGAGPAGLLTALNAAKIGAKVALSERDRFGGACFNVGCIPSKTIIRTSRLYAEMRDAENFGAQVPTGISVDFAAVMERMRRVRARISRRVSAQRLSSAGGGVYFGEARWDANWRRPFLDWVRKSASRRTIRCSWATKSATRRRFFPTLWRVTAS